MLQHHIKGNGINLTDKHKNGLFLHSTTASYKQEIFDMKCPTALICPTLNCT